MKNDLAIIFLTALLGIVAHAQTVKYPMILWSETAFTASSESSGAMHD